ncbi:MAG: PKD domain-containing protein, partial [Methanocalculus sp. MSAO_Arc2]|uniref:DUF7948 domain-containing protein n=1 Tax=Methanocalculus sp. MSAO_Arc2 TaxID=2293855 RepID=UPI000FEDAD46
MKSIQDSGRILLILLLCTCLMSGAGAVETSSADGNIAFEQYWHQLGPGTYSDDATSQTPHPLLQWNRNVHTFLIPGINGENTPGIAVAPTDPPADLLSSSGYSGQDTLDPEFIRTLSSGFIKNRGQYDPAVEYVLQYQGTTVFFTQDGFVLTHTAGDAENRTTDVIRQTFGGASPDVSIVGLEEREGRVNYYVGNDSSQWLADIPVYGEILYEDLYPGIDLVYSEENGRLKREFRVAPGASFDLIEILYDDEIIPSVDDAGVLRLASPAGEMLESPLVCWQVMEGEIVPRTATYVIEEGSVWIAVDGYDPDYELVIDPELVYSTYLGGSDWDYGRALAPDGAGGVWVTGETHSANFPVTGDAYQDEIIGEEKLDNDAFISRFSSTGALLYSTYFGGRSRDYGRALLHDGSGGVWVAGMTGSTDFPLTTDAHQGTYGGCCLDAFICRFSSTGSLLYSTYLGGSNYDWGNALASDDSGGIWIAGYTGSNNFPVTDDAYQGSHGGYADAFVSRFSSTGALLYSTYLGGSNWDRGYALTPDGAGGVWIAGYTESDDFPVTADAYQGSHGGDGDVFVSRFSSSGALLYSTYFGGSRSDQCRALAPDDSGGIWVTGSTSSTNFPVTSDAYQSTGSGAFVSRFSSAGALIYSTYLGGSSWDVGRALAPDGSDGVWVAGQTRSTNFPVTDDAYQGSRHGSRAAFVSRFSSAGALEYSTYLGGSDEEGWYYGLAPDGAGGVWITGETMSDDFPVTPDAYQGSYGGGEIWRDGDRYYMGGDAFVSRFSVGTPTTPPTAAFTANPTSGTAPLTVQFTDLSTNTPISWRWEYSTGGGWMQFSTSQHPSYQFTSTGTYSIRLTATNAAGSDADTKTGYITVTDFIPHPLYDEMHGVFRSGQWIFAEGEHWTPTHAWNRPQFGQGGDIPVVVDGTPGVFRNGQWIFAEDEDWTPTPAAERRQFGMAGDVPVVVDGKPGVFRNGQWIFAEDADWTPTPAWNRPQFGQGGDIPVVVDGKPGVFRNGQWIFAEDAHWTPTPAADRRQFGQ